MTTHSNLPRSEKLSKIRSLLLNKVRNLDWYYFNIDLNSAVSPDTRLTDQGLLERIEITDDGHYTFNEGGNSSSRMDNEAILATALRQILFSLKKDKRLIRDILKSIFDVNEPLLPNAPGHEDGLLGRLNKADFEERREIFWEKIRNGFRSNPENIVIMAEGDSWYEFPKVFAKDPVKDILDWLIKRDDCAVFSLAYGGDWLSNIVAGAEYIEELPKVGPHVFLLSGGGNDMVDFHRISTMVRSPQMGPRDLEKEPLLQQLIEKRKQHRHPTFDLDRYLNGLKWINDEYFQFVNACMAQYFLLIYELTHVKRYEDLVFLTQGYDYVIPSRERRGAWISFHRLVNQQLDTGKWVYDALMLKGITDPQTQKDVIFTMITEFNEMLISLANYKGFPNLYHIDCRGVAEDEDDWFDEIHLRSEKFELVSNKYYEVIGKALKKETTQKVYRVIE